MGAPVRVDLNADLGEDDDLAAASPLLDVVTTAHLACGFHAGDASVMRATAAAAAAAGVVVGAHPAYPDRAGFGRRAVARPPAAVADDVLYQLGALDAVARAAGTRVRSVKPHGALYHAMARDEACAGAVAGAVAAHDPTLVLVTLAGSATLDVLAASGLRVVAEGFCDRAYRPDGTLAARAEPGAVVTDPDDAARRAVAMALDGMVVTTDGSSRPVVVDTLCVHGDTPGAVAIAGRVRRALEAAGVVVASCSPPS